MHLLFIDKTMKWFELFNFYNINALKRMGNEKSDFDGKHNFYNTIALFGNGLILSMYFLSNNMLDNTIDSMNEFQ